MKKVGCLLRHDSRLITGIRVVNPHWYPSSALGSIRDWSGVHVYDNKAPAAGYQGGGQELDPGMFRGHCVTGGLC